MSTKSLKNSHRVCEASLTGRSGLQWDLQKPEVKEFDRWWEWRQWIDICTQMKQTTEIMTKPMKWIRKLIPKRSNAYRPS